MAKGTTYYYFRVRRPNLTDIVPYAIKESSFYIDDNIMLNFKQMTDEQKAFYLEHPTASVQEVWKCELNPPYVPPAPDLVEYREQRIKELKDKCYNYVSQTSLIVVMALDKGQNITGDSYFSLPESKQILADFRAESKHAMTVLATYRPQIEAAQSVEAVDAAYEQAIDAL